MNIKTYRATDDSDYLAVLQIEKHIYMNFYGRTPEAATNSAKQFYDQELERQRKINPAFDPSLITVSQGKPKRVLSEEHKQKLREGRAKKKEAIRKAVKIND